ncbi:hypothetical protein HOD71_00030 [Candidatus Peribacteria bacterium]|jgi:hypothetical protein|nr:hypothetical protein [Candidatus Peribacteria bacterium]MBT4240272.1 hypothetical protein [Candidatus Peribacteria bacterium]MBT4474333.1 hypothetical protein [Candidatus Peribacteria bacterium]
MSIKNLNPFVPADPQRVSKFMEGVQPLAPPVHRQIIDTAKQIANAVSGTGVTIVTSPLAVAEAGLYAGANAMGIPTAILNKCASMTNHVRTRMFRACNKMFGVNSHYG